MRGAEAAEDGAPCTHVDARFDFARSVAAARARAAVGLERRARAWNRSGAPLGARNKATRRPPPSLPHSLPPPSSVLIAAAFGAAWKKRNTKSRSTNLTLADAFADPGHPHCCDGAARRAEVALVAELTQTDAARGWAFAYDVSWRESFSGDAFRAAATL